MTNFEDTEYAEWKGPQNSQLQGMRVKGSLQPIGVVREIFWH